MKIGQIDEMEVGGDRERELIFFVGFEYRGEGYS